MFLLVLCLAAGLALASGKKEDKGTTTGTTTTVAAGKHKEAPMLTERVRAGKLPLVDDRLPKEPAIVGPVVLIPEKDLDWKVGGHGGTMRTVRNSPNSDASIFIQNDRAMLQAQGLNVQVLTPNVVGNFEVSPDQRQFTV